MPLLTLIGYSNYLEGGLLYQSIPYYLPQMYQTARYARIPELAEIVSESFDSLRLDIKTFEELIDIYRVPYGFIPKLAALLDLTIPQGTTDTEARKLLWECVEVYKIKGTADSITRILLKLGSYSILIFPTYPRMFLLSDQNARLSGSFKIQGSTWRPGVYEVVTSLSLTLWQYLVEQVQPAGKRLIPNVVVAEAWQPNTEYEIGDMVIPTTTAYNGRIFQCLAPGISASTEPSWPPTGYFYLDGVLPDSNTETSGMVLWQDMGYIVDLIQTRLLPSISWTDGAPSAGLFQRGSIAYDTSSTAFAGWYCTEGGVPGTWIQFGSMGGTSGTAGTGTLATTPYIAYGTAPPSTGTFWGAGSIMINSVPVSAGWDGWKCVMPAGSTGGSGVWQVFGVIAV
jgi:Phage tail protein (Tail_P2_I)